MTIAKRPALPLILTANDVLDGDVVFRTREGWSRLLEFAFVATVEEQAAELETALTASKAHGEVVEPYLVTVRTDAKACAVPNHYRERIRALGPTVAFGPGPEAKAEAV